MVFRRECRQRRANSSLSKINSILFLQEMYLIDYIDEVVIGKTVRFASLFAFAFFEEAAAIREPMLDLVDRLLEDLALLALSTQALAGRSPGSDKVGREGMAPDRLLRCAVLKHLKGWSYRELPASQPSNTGASPAFMRTCWWLSRITNLVARPEAFFKVMAAEASFKHYLALVEKVIGQSQARIFQAQTRHPDKILSLTRAARQKQRWFRRGQGWRAGIEARLSTLKHRFGMQRALYKGETGFERYVGWCIIAIILWR
jgi:hypothetical protein